jgi:hypothetical protein
VFGYCLGTGWEGEGFDGGSLHVRQAHRPTCASPSTCEVLSTCELEIFLSHLPRRRYLTPSEKVLVADSNTRGRLQVSPFGIFGILRS